MTLAVSLPLYLGAGILSDLLVTGYYVSVSRGLSWAAALVSIPVALLNFWVLNRILIVDLSWSEAVAYAVGNAVGCFVIMQVNRRLGCQSKKNAH
jgi:uncharacterized protein YebE (UPF0316 family)